MLSAFKAALRLPTRRLSAPPVPPCPHPHHRRLTCSLSRRLHSPRGSDERGDEQTGVKGGRSDDDPSRRGGAILRKMSAVIATDQSVAERCAKLMDKRSLERLCEAVQNESAYVPKPSNRQLSLVALSSCVAFIGFGFCDNFIMIIAGDLIDTTLCVVLGLSTLAAAGIGNTVSDILGVWIGGFIEDMGKRIGIPQHNLNTSQMKRTITTIWSNGGSAVGVTIGCLVGMFPLLIMDTETAERRRVEDQTHQLFDIVEEELRGVLEVEQATLYLISTALEELQTKYQPRLHQPDHVSAADTMASSTGGNGEEGRSVLAALFPSVCGGNGQKDDDLIRIQLSDVDRKEGLGVVIEKKKLINIDGKKAAQWKSYPRIMRKQDMPPPSPPPTAPTPIRSAAAPLPDSIVEAPKEDKKKTKVAGEKVGERGGKEEGSRVLAAPKQVMAAPIISTTGEVIGVIEAINSTRGARFRATDEEILRSVCTQLAVPLEGQEVQHTLQHPNAVRKALWLCRGQVLCGTQGGGVSARARFLADLPPPKQEGRVVVWLRSLAT
ncbi:unnamed protein product [Vitrella brassicaformis CCMP3155]|uniref:GAF domain-containing protein n=3 Tax=Vitrella brassicaformis TaxID=1169539 RepID=A0A0G4H2T7_VITBC|nr:unnamed protein product [Vitrella brassicaformis CCMP3155]|mmetsp:Transcript_26820/g.76979  ORF Transcript_26820/g.76979 Transcript_26820/m.76979 type:complete len:550 (+) Transcript_26820:561-2210(+)|eukprot:CEM37979.1 unnamed protein product [Vitrella brassicaformis CCMP3155]